MENDLSTVGEDLENYVNSLDNDVLQKGTNEYNENFDFTLPGNTTVNTPEQIRFFMIFVYEVLYDTQKIIDEILGELGDNDDWRNYVTELVQGSTINFQETSFAQLNELDDPFINSTPTSTITGLKYQYDTIYKFSKNKISNFVNENTVKKVISYNPFNPQKERKFEYVKEIQNPVQKEEYFNILYRKDNSEGTQFNGKKHFN